MNTPFEKKLIVNGSLNKSLTLDEILENFSADGWIDAAWNLAVNLNVRHGLDNTPSHNDICENPKEQLLSTWELHEKHTAEKKLKDDRAEFKKGCELFDFMSNMQLTSHSIEFRNPILPMSPQMAKGYLSKESGWNNYEPIAFTRCISEIESLSLRKDHGVNNPNTGAEMTTFIKNNDYWYVSFAVSQDRQDEFLKEYQARIEILLESCGTQSVGIEKRNLELIFVAWWD